MSIKEFKFLLRAYFGWLAVLFLILIVAVKFVPLQQNFLGGGLENYLTNPYLWAWGNFDGEHYISIARLGYGFGEHAFFPLYPILIRIVSDIGGFKSPYLLNLAGILISNISFFIGLTGFYKLLRLDFSERFSRLAIVFLLVFPTSFYFAGVYTESLFFVLAVWSFYFARRGNFLFASLLGVLLTATRFVGLVILPVILVEWFLQNRKKESFLKTFPGITLAIPTGLLAYMYYLKRTTGDMFAFFNSLKTFGEQRSSHLITLPQVFYRYIFKILPGLNTGFFPVIFTTVLEFAIGGIFLLLSLLAFLRMRLSYSVFLFLGYLIPTFSGSFSSLPRYVLVLFPVYILTAQLLEKRKAYLIAFGVISFIFLAISFALFARGYWLS